MYHKALLLRRVPERGGGMTKATSVSRGYPAFCGECANPIDLVAVQKAVRDKERYVHDCGRVLVGKPGEGLK